MTNTSSCLDGASTAGIEKESEVAPGPPEGVAFTHRVEAGRTTVLWIWAASSLLLFGPALAGDFGHLPGLLAVTLAFAVMVRVPLHATIEVDSGGRLTIRYLIYSFSDRLENVQVEATSKFDFRCDERLGVKRLYQGTRLPCFNVGWFVLKNGAVAFVCLSRKRRARALKTRDGCYILMDPSIALRIQAVANLCDATRRQ